MTSDSPHTVVARLEKLVGRLHRMHAVRHRAVKRLQNHETHSKWTLTLLVTAVIIVEVETLSGVHLYFCQEYVHLMTIVFSVMTLAYSLLLGMGDYSGKSVKMYHCALALGELKRKADPQLLRTKNVATEAVDSEDSEKKYARLIRDYNVILNRCENHNDIDYLQERFKNCSERTACMSLIMTWHFLVPFIHYYLSLILVYWWIYLYSFGK